MIDFRVTGLPASTFSHLFGRTDDELRALGVQRIVANETPGFPDRIEMRDVEPGETVLLLNYEHQPVNSPYRSSHAIFIREGATQRYDRINEVPDVMRGRLLSLRAFDDCGTMIDADVIDGTRTQEAIQRFFSDPNVAYIHVHNAKRGCYSGRVDRV